MVLTSGGKLGQTVNVSRHTAKQGRARRIPMPPEPMRSVRRAAVDHDDLGKLPQPLKATRQVRLLVPDTDGDRDRQYQRCAVIGHLRRYGPQKGRAAQRYRAFGYREFASLPDVNKLRCLYR